MRDPLRGLEVSLRGVIIGMCISPRQWSRDEVENFLCEAERQSVQAPSRALSPPPAAYSSRGKSHHYQGVEWAMDGSHLRSSGRSPAGTDIHLRVDETPSTMIGLAGPTVQIDTKVTTDIEEQRWCS
jgi:hypothetical protein